MKKELEGDKPGGKEKLRKETSKKITPKLKNSGRKVKYNFGKNKK
jgi:hypothetical protein